MVSQSNEHVSQSFPSSHQPAQSCYALHPEKNTPETLQVQISWNGCLFDVGHFTQPRAVTVGPHPLNDFTISHDVFGASNYPLIVPEGSQGYNLFLTEDFAGTWKDQQGQLHPIRERFHTLERSHQDGKKGYLFPLESGAHVNLIAGSLEVEVNFVSSEVMEGVPYPQQREFIWWRLLSASAIFHAFVILLFQFLPSGAQALQQSKLLGKFSVLLPGPLSAPKPSKPKFQIKKRKPPKVVRPRNTNVKTKARGTISKKMVRDVSKAGLLGDLRSAGLESNNLFGKANSQKWLGKVLTTTGSSSLAVSLGYGQCFGSQCGQGGGGEIYGSAGSFGTPGGTGTYARRNIRNLKTRRTKKGKIKFSEGRTQIHGSLQKSEISRVVRAHWYLIKYCYEKQLRQNAKLQGKIELKWVINGAGYVQTVAVRQTTMNNEQVEGCLMRRVRRFKFPQPRGGGIVVVRYPFLFSQVR